MNTRKGLKKKEDEGFIDKLWYLHIDIQYNIELKYDDLITGQLIVHVVDKDGNKSELKAGLKTTSIKRKELLISNVRRFMESNKGFSPTKIEIRSPKKYGKAI